MSIHCDAEYDLHTMEAGGYTNSPAKVLSGGECKVPWSLPDDMVDIIAGYSCELLSDELAFSLLSYQHHGSIMRIFDRRVGSSESLCVFDLEGVCEYFMDWSRIRFGCGPEYVSEDFECLSFFCKECRQLVITQREVESPHYHGGFGPAFLAHSVFNCNYSVEEAYETQFTTGVYRVCDVMCGGCDTRLGKKYIESRDVGNMFKVGKILLEQTLLIMPKCCDNRKLNDTFPPEHYFCAREEGAFCSVCFKTAETSVAKAVLAMTSNSLLPIPTMKLLGILLCEGAAQTRGPHAPTGAISRVLNKFLPVSPTQKGEKMCDFLQIGSPKSAGISKMKPSPPNSEINALIGSRISLIPGCQDWNRVLAFVSKIIHHNHSEISRGAILESLLENCGEISTQSATLLLSRVNTLEERKSIMEGLARNTECEFDDSEWHTLGNIATGNWTRHL